MKKKDMIKTVGGIIVSLGVGAIISNIVESTTPKSVGSVKRICIGIGALVLTAMLTDKVVAYAEEKIDNSVKSVETMVKNGELS